MDPGIDNWGLPLIVLTVVIHAAVLGAIGKKVSSTLSSVRAPQDLSTCFDIGHALGGFSATILHAFEACLWAGAYLFLGALQEKKSAMLYSMNAMTSYGHVNFQLAPYWQMIGAGSVERLDFV